MNQTTKHFRFSGLESDGFDVKLHVIDEDIVASDWADARDFLGKVFPVRRLNGDFDSYHRVEADSGCLERQSEALGSMALASMCSDEHLWLAF